MSSTAALFSLAVTRCPSGAWNTKRASAPWELLWGNRSSSRSNAFCDSVPGMERSSSFPSGAVAAATPASTRATSHTALTSRRRRKAHRPIR